MADDTCGHNPPQAAVQRLLGEISERVPIGQKSDDDFYLWKKDEVDAQKHKLNGLATTVEGAGIRFHGLALGLTPVRIDFTGLKIDEKGMVLAGVQKWTCPHKRSAHDGPPPHSHATMPAEPDFPQ
ncbi:hypothetical protein [Streptomyces sp. NPDC101150]|uniref:hypothetical protein n=1 Tax=Streptomyces sp. NPDC101150 TaxID=3366114 RepID=UPI0037F2A59D